MDMDKTPGGDINNQGPDGSMIQVGSKRQYGNKSEKISNQDNIISGRKRIESEQMNASEQNLNIALRGNLLPPIQGNYKTSNSSSKISGECYDRQANLFHTSPENIAKIDRALKPDNQKGIDFIRTEDVIKNFHEKFTVEDLELKLHQNDDIINIKNQVLKNNKSVQRIAQQVHGFIVPTDMTLNDYKFSFTTNKQDEEAINAGLEEDKNQNDDINDSIDDMMVNEQKETYQDLDLVKRIIINHEGLFSLIWAFFDIICCLTSSYFYLWLATFGENGDSSKCYVDMSNIDKEAFNEQASFSLRLTVAFELIFAFSILTKFLTDYKPDGETEHVKSLSKITSKYLHGDFIFDLIPLIPLPFIFKNVFCQSKLFYMIKCIRVLNGFKLFDVSQILSKIKTFSQERMEKMIKTNYKLAEDMDQDNNQIENLMIVNYLLKTFKLIIIIINISFFLGMFWLIYCDVTMNITRAYQVHYIEQYAIENRWDQAGNKTECDELIAEADVAAIALKKKQDKKAADQKAIADQKTKDAKILASGTDAEKAALKLKQQQAAAKKIKDAEEALKKKQDKEAADKVAAAAQKKKDDKILASGTDAEIAAVMKRLAANTKTVTKPNTPASPNHDADSHNSATCVEDRTCQINKLDQCIKLQDERDKQYHPEYFIDYFEINKMTNTMQAIVGMYYSFTSLTTVGFGDYNPRSEFERIFCAMILLFGVAIFSYIMGNFIEILEQIKQLDEELDDGDNLTRFFGLLQRFNGNKSINLELRQKIEVFFDYKWNNDRNMAIDDEQEIALLEQLPAEVQDKLISGFLFNQFLSKFSDFFRLQKGSNTLLGSSKKDKYGKSTNVYYTWVDQNYRDFMNKLLTNLEPRKDARHSILVDELDEFNEISFINNGEVVIGYEINKQRRYCIHFKNKCVIGAYGITFNKRAAFIYTALTTVEGFFIRKNNWLDLLSISPEIAFVIKKNVLMDYLCKIRLKVMVNKRKAIEKIQTRHDHQMIQVSAMKDIYSQQQLINENFGDDQNQKEQVEKEYQEYQIGYFSDRMKEYEKIVANLLDDVQRKEDILYDLQEELEQIEAEIEREKESQRMAESSRQNFDSTPQDNEEEEEEE